MPKSVLGVVARILARPESAGLVREALRSLLEPTRAEVGCIIYELMQNEADPTDFTFYEEWTDAPALDAHARSPHIAAAFARLDGHLAAPPDVRRYSHIDL
ncbi:MAG TPA: putative quinol monooxygenase [Vicinamibacterales bacterium]|nr:putative quinol monooxygenase [Vicinamibacterales bacterium]